MAKAKPWMPTPTQKAKANHEAAAYVAKHPKDKALIERALMTFYGIELKTEVPF